MIRFLCIILFVVGCSAPMARVGPAICDDEFSFVCEGDVYCVDDNGDVLVDQLGNELRPVCTHDGPDCRGSLTDSLEVSWHTGNVICVQ